MYKKLFKHKNTVLLSILGASLYACNSGSTQTNNLFLNSGVFTTHYTFESSDANAVFTCNTLFKPESLVSNGAGQLCVESAGGITTTCYENVNYAYNPCYNLFSKQGGGIFATFENTQWQNCQFESTGGTADLYYVFGTIPLDLPIPVGGCKGTLTITQESL